MSIIAHIAAFSSAVFPLAKISISTSGASNQQTKTDKKKSIRESGVDFELELFRIGADDVLLEERGDTGGGDLAERVGVDVVDEGLDVAGEGFVVEDEAFGGRAGEDEL